MVYGVEIGLGAVIYTYIPCFVKIGLGIQKLADVDKQRGDRISLTYLPTELSHS
jgi:hypothetical protein